MRPRDVTLAVLVAVAWGIQFVIVAGAVTDAPPLLFAAVRFAAVAFPAMLFIRRPRVPLHLIAAVGLTLSAGQFGLQYLALHAGMPPGLLSLVLQSQVVFTVAIAALTRGERPTRQQLAGLIVAVAGIVVVAWGYGAGGTQILPLILVLGAGLSWGAGNVLTRAAGPAAGFGLTIWSAAAAPLPLLVLSLIVEGPAADWAALTHPTANQLVALLYTVLIASIFGYGVWVVLLSRHPSGQVAPFSLLVPVVGILTAWLAVGERPSGLEIVGGTLMLAGALLCIARFAALSRPERRAARCGR